MKSEYMIASELLESGKAKIGDKLIFENGVRGMVISGTDIDIKCVFNGQAILLTHYSSGITLNDVAYGYLDMPCRILDEVKK